MAKGIVQFSNTNLAIRPEQVLAAFDIGVDPSNNKAFCPFHDDTNPSLQVNEDYVYCYGCGISYDVYGLAKALLPEETNVYRWFETTKFKEPKLAFKKSQYKGSVPSDLINYWHECLIERPDLQQELQEQRLFTNATIKIHKLGYRIEHDSFVIPYNDGEIVQFNSRTDRFPKYYGLTGHQRGAVMNQDLLDVSREFVVVLLGAYDGILARQDGLPAVSLNGAFPFKRTEKARVQEIFKHQTMKFVVPDNTPDEYKPARRLASWLNAKVRYFDAELPPDTDYIDYRKMGKTSMDFCREVLGIEPYTTPDPQTVKNLVALLNVGNRFNFAEVHLGMANLLGTPARDVALAISKEITNIELKRRLYEVIDVDSLVEVFRDAYQLQGGW